MRRLLLAALLCADGALAQVASYAEALVKQGRLDDARQLTAQWQRQAGNTPETLAALSWLARGEFAAGKPAKALAQAEEVQRAAAASLGARKLDAEPFLPLALGASYEVQAEALVAQSRRAEALQLLNTAARDWAGTSITARLRKNILSISLVGHPLPRLHAMADVWRGKPVLFFFWAHWCADCKADAPVVAKLAREFAPRGLVTVLPTRLYGYTAQEEHASPAAERQFLDRVYARYYAAIPNAGVPVDAANFDLFGASTTPTIILADPQGIVRLYHPGYLSEADLRKAIEATLVSSLTSRR